MTKFFQKYPLALWTVGVIAGTLIAGQPWYVGFIIGGVAGFFIPLRK